MNGDLKMLMLDAGCLMLDEMQDTDIDRSMKTTKHHSNLTNKQFFAFRYFAISLFIISLNPFPWMLRISTEGSAFRYFLRRAMKTSMLRVVK
jgi:hypothetical protein